MVESVVKNKSLVSKRRKLSLEQNIQPLSLSTTLAQDLTSIGKTSIGFYNQQCLELVSRLFVPHKTVSLERDLPSSRKYSNHKVVESPLLMSQHLVPITSQSTTSLDLSPLISTPTTVKEVKEEIVTTRMMEIEPVRPKRWFRLLTISRRAYNLSVASFNEHGFELGKVKHEVHGKVAEEVDVNGLYELVNEAFRDTTKAFSKLLSESKKDGKRRSLSFRSRKSPKQSFKVNRMGLQGPLPRLMAKSDTATHSAHTTSFRFKERKQAIRWYKNHHNRKPTEKEINEFYLKDNVNERGNQRTGVVTFENGRWYISVYKIRKTKAKTKPTTFISLDPGTKPFLSGYDGRKAIRIGKDLHKRLLSIDKKIDKVVSRRTISLNAIKQAQGEESQLLYNMERYWKRKLDKLRHRRRSILVHFHWKVASWLTTHYDVILLPKLETQRIVTGTKRKALNRNIVSLNHYEFLSKITYLSEVNGCYLLHPDESHTSKTLCLNGYYNTELGSSKTFKYQDIEIDRDVNASINILLKALIATPVTSIGV